MNDTSKMKLYKLKNVMSLQFIEAKNQSWRREERKKKNSNLKAAETDNLFRSMYLMRIKL